MRLISVIGIAICLIELLAPRQAEAQTGAWSPPTPLSRADGGWFPDVVADDLGSIYVVWQGNFSDQAGDTSAGAAQRPMGRSRPRPSNGLTPLFYTSWNGSEWSPPNDIALICCGHALRSSLALDADRQLHLIYKGMGTLDSMVSQGGEDIWHAAADAADAGSATAWQTKARLNREPQGYFTDVAIDSRGIIHAIFTEAGLGRWGIYYRNSADGGKTWSSRVALENVRPIWWYRAQLMVDAWDRVHVTWETFDPRVDRNGNMMFFGSGRDAVYALSSDGGHTWTKSEWVGPQQPAVGVDGSGTILLVYRELGSDRMLFRRSNDGVIWFAPEPLPGIGKGVHRPFDVYDTVTDSAGKVHLVVVGKPAFQRVVTEDGPVEDEPTTMYLYHLEWNGQRWSAPSVIATSPPFPEYPRLAVSNGNRLHVVWFGGDRDIDRRPTGIWYSTAVTAAPYIPPVVTAASAASSLLVDDLAESSAAEEPAASSPLLNFDYLSSLGGWDELPSWLEDFRRSQTFPIVVGVAPVLILLSLVFLWGILLREMPGILRRRLND